MLEETDIVPYLLRRRLLDPDAVLDGAVRIGNTSRRNQNFHVTGAGNGVFVKQGMGRSGVGSVGHEARVLECLAALPGPGELRTFLPRVLGFDSAQEVLVLEYVADAHDLCRYHSRLGRFPKRIAEQTGHVLSNLHAVPTQQLDSGMKLSTPWVLAMH